MTTKFKSAVTFTQTVTLPAAVNPTDAISKAGAETLANTAESNATAAAATDATTKANAAQAAAIAAAATDATTKANTAEANAKAYADTLLSDVAPVTFGGALNDNQVAAAYVSATLDYNVAAANGAFFDYAIKRGANIEVGRIILANTDSGGTVPIAVVVDAFIGDCGVVFSTEEAGGNVKLKYTSTNTGTAPVIKMKRTLLNP